MQSTFYERVYNLSTDQYAPVLATILPITGILGGESACPWNPLSLFCQRVCSRPVALTLRCCWSARSGVLRMEGSISTVHAALQHRSQVP